MKNVEPTLPPANSFDTFTQNRLPIRHPRTNGMSQNKTGAFIPGVKSRQDISSRHTIPPLARPRGAATSSSNKYQQQSYGQQQQTMKHLHSSMDWKGGFHPQPVKKQKPKPELNHKGYVPNPHVISGVPKYRDVARKSVRNLVAVCNSGVTHLEELRSDSYSIRSGRTTRDSMVVESVKTDENTDLKSLAGFKEFYKNVLENSYCNDHPTSHHGSSRYKSANTSSGTPLLIRSFRNPQNPHPVIQYADVKHQTNSSPERVIAKPPVPSPYFYNSRNLSKASDNGGARVQLSRYTVLSQSAENVLAAPGAGSLSRSALNSRQKGELPMSIKGQRPPSLPTKAKLVESDELLRRKEICGPAVTPATSNTSLNKVGKETGNDERIDEDERKPDVVIPEMSAESQSVASTSKETIKRNKVPDGKNESLVQRPNTDGDLQKEPDGQAWTEADDAQSVVSNTVSIIISLEGADGASKIIDVDEEEEMNRQEVLQNQVLPQVEAATDEMRQGSSVDKQVELQQLLQEHSEIVSEIHKLEKLTCKDNGGNDEDT